MPTRRGSTEELSTSAVFCAVPQAMMKNTVATSIANLRYFLAMLIILPFWSHSGLKIDWKRA
jgi:hypothetical protein